MKVFYDVSDAASDANPIYNVNDTCMYGLRITVKWKRESEYIL